ncbi:glycosyltransferase family 4 protein [Ancylobacter lacus]|uniref:glycosyltransferase family 4 protein n=1 Tax=Ancylobacter lacus TaxID=2579970 RepID=UPI001BD11F9A|nr:glycosyltransferase family 4 protein [Ancylobacter lacus]MBS7538480.1 glycosyltransferase family 4 protein [Ancylobacter lacus]
MKTLQIGLDWFPERAGGLPRYYYDLFHAAPAAGIELRGLVAGSAKVAQDSNGAVRAFAPISASLPSRLMAARKAIGQTASAFRPDLLVSHFALYTLPGLGTFDCPMAVHFHGPWAFESAVEGHAGLRRSAKMALEKAVYARAQRFIVLSRAFGSLLTENFGVPEERVRVIPGGIDLARFDITMSRQEARARLGWPQDRRIIVAVRRLVRRMGLGNLVEAMADIVRRHPDVLLLIGGRGPMADELKASIERLGLEQHVRLLGFVSNDDLPLAYRAADMSVVPTVALEGFGLIAAESLAAGTPALVTPVGGLPEVVAALDPNLIFEGVDVRHLAERFDDILSGRIALPDEKACRRYAEEHFNWDDIVLQIRAVYAEAVAGGRS